MQFSRFWFSLLAVILAASAFGQEKAPKAQPGDKPPESQIEVHFADDSVVKMALLQSSIDVSTRYGKLTLPVGEIRRIDFGLRIPDETAKRIEAAIARLSNPDIKQRDSAQAELVELKELAYPALQQAARSTDSEVSLRAKEAMKTISQTLPAQQFRQPRNDTIVTAEFTIVGRIETPTLKARTPYFGDANLKLFELKSMRWLSTGHETKLMVDAAKYGSQQDMWLDTGVEVRSGAMLQVAAGGRVELGAQNGFPGGSVVGPDGQFTRGGRAAFNPNAQFGGRGGRGGPGFARGASMSPGALLGRIGETGSIFVLGSRYEAPAHEDGKLYIRIAPSTDGSRPSGSYDIRIAAGK